MTDPYKMLVDLYEKTRPPERGIFWWIWTHKTYESGYFLSPFDKSVELFLLDVLARGGKFIVVTEVKE